MWASDLKKASDYYALLENRGKGVPAEIKLGVRNAGAERKIIANFDEVKGILDGWVKSSRPDLTFQSILFESLSLREQAALLRRTKILVGLWGAGMTQCVFMPTGALFVQLTFERGGDDVAPDESDLARFCWLSAGIKLATVPSSDQKQVGGGPVEAYYFAEALVPVLDRVAVARPYERQPVAI